MSFVDVNEGAAVSQLIPGGYQNLKVSKDYLFDASTNFVKVNDSGSVGIVSIYNETTNQLVYLRGSENLTGTTFKSEVVFDFSNSGMADGDLLYILYQTELADNVETLLEKLITLQKENNKLLKKILE